MSFNCPWSAPLLLLFRCQRGPRSPSVKPPSFCPSPLRTSFVDPIVASMIPISTAAVPASAAVSAPAQAPVTAH